MTETYSEGTFEDVARYKFEQAEDDLETAKILLAAGKYKAANNRAYYACFHAVDAVLAKEPIAFKKHKDTLSYFITKITCIQKFFQRISGVKSQDLRLSDIRATMIRFI